MGVVATASISNSVQNVAAGEIKHEEAMAQRPQVEGQSARPAAPRLLSVEIIPDAPADGVVIRVQKVGARVQPGVPNPRK